MSGSSVPPNAAPIGQVATQAVGLRAGGEGSKRLKQESPEIDPLLANESLALAERGMLTTGRSMIEVQPRDVYNLGRASGSVNLTRLGRQLGRSQEEAIMRNLPRANFLKPKEREMVEQRSYTPLKNRQVFAKPLSIGTTHEPTIPVHPFRNKESTMNQYTMTAQQRYIDQVTTVPLTKIPPKKVKINRFGIQQVNSHEDEDVLYESHNWDHYRDSSRAGPQVLGKLFCYHFYSKDDEDIRRNLSTYGRGLFTSR